MRLLIELFIFNFPYYFLLSYLLTPPNFRVCAQRKVPAKRFKICHILYIRNPKDDFSIFDFVHKMKNAKSIFGFSYTYIKYGKFWSVSLELFVEHKLWNWEEWHMITSNASLLALHIPSGQYIGFQFSSTWCSSFL